MVAYLEHMFAKRLDAMQSMVYRLPGVALPPHPEEQPRLLCRYSFHG